MNSVQLRYSSALIEGAGKLQPIVVSFETPETLTLFTDFNNHLKTTGAELVYPKDQHTHPHAGYKFTIKFLQSANPFLPMFHVFCEKVHIVS